MDLYPRGQAEPMQWALREPHMPLQSGRPREEPGDGGRPVGPALEALLEWPDHRWPEEGVEGSISGEAKAPIQAVKREPGPERGLRFLMRCSGLCSHPCPGTGARAGPAQSQPFSHTQ